MKVDGHDVEVSSEAKVLFPARGLTKGDLARYYRDVAPAMLPHVRGRPVTMMRYPRGVDRPGFVQQAAPEGAPPFVHTAEVEKEEGGALTRVTLENAATLVWLAHLNTVTPHVWLSRLDRPHHPDRLVFDLDPPGDQFEPARHAAGALRDLLDALSLPAFVMTSGSRGLHVTVPLDRALDFDAVRAFARGVAEALARRHPDALTVEQRKAERGERLYLDVMRNAYGQTAVPPYAVRARPEAPVATPLRWAELDDPALNARRFTITDVPARLAEAGDPWADLDAHAAALDEAARRLARL